MIKGYKSIKTLIAKVYRDLNLTEEDRWVSMIEWAAEALQLIGAHSQFTNPTKILTVEAFRVKLPCDFYKVVQISYNGSPLQYGSGSFDTTFHCTDCVNLKTQSQYVYTINNSFIFTNFDGEICLSYLAIPTDEDGFPLIPDDVTYDEAIFRYIITKLYYPQFLSGKMAPAVYDKLENDWNYKCMQARGTANMPNLDQMEALKNQWLRLIPDVNRHSNFFKDLNFGESIHISK